MTAQLEVVSEGRFIDLADGNSYLVGREADCEIVLENPAISRHHFKVLQRGVEWLIEDLGSRHGTRLNGARMESAQSISLRDRDCIEVAGTQVIFHAAKLDFASEEHTSFLAQQMVADMLGSLGNEDNTPYLRVLSGKREGDRILLDGRKPFLILGRDHDCDICLDEANVSRRHCRFDIDFSGIWVEDLESKNGVKIHGSEITERTKLRDRTEITVGATSLVFVDPAAAFLGELDESQSNIPLSPEDQHALEDLSHEATEAEDSSELPLEDDLVEVEPSVDSVDPPDDELDEPVTVIATEEDLESLTAQSAELSAPDRRLELDDSGEWSKSLPAVEEVPNREETRAISSPVKKAQPDWLMLGIFGGAVLVFLFALILLLVL
ncbi:MAG: hypothetical protein CMH55_08900 [Myxococcales bacterium]|nr:hypothetical protein [Myxococcales bacterium]